MVSLGILSIAKILEIILGSSLARAACSTDTLTTYPEVKDSHRVLINSSLNSNSFSVAAYISPNYYADSSFKPTQGHVWIHGQDRNADEMVTSYKAAKSAALLNGDLGNVNDTVMLAPIFAHQNDAAKTMFPQALTWDCNDWTGGADSETLAVSSFNVLRSSLSFLATQYPSITTFVLAGHSAGGQIVQRWAIANPDSTNESPNRYVIANPSSYAYFTDARSDCTVNSTCICAAPGYAECCTGFNDWKYGLQDYTYRYQSSVLANPDSNFLSARYAARTIRYLFGTADDSGQTNGCASNAQGLGHFDRGQKWWAYLQNLVPTVAQTQRADNVTNVGHNSTLMFDSQEGTAALFLD